MEETRINPIAMAGFVMGRFVPRGRSLQQCAHRMGLTLIIALAVAILGACSAEARHTA